MKRLVVFDVDSTLIQEEVIELLADRAGLRDQVKQVTDRAMAGEIDFRESLMERVDLLKGLNEEVFQQIRPAITITPGVEELIGAVHASGGFVGAISGGFTQVLKPLALHLKLDVYRANTLEVIDTALTGRLTGEIVDAEAKAITLRDWAIQFEIAIGDTVAIGDGANDIQMLQAAGFAVGFRPKQILREYADHVVEENSMMSLVKVLNLSSS